MTMLEVKYQGDNDTQPKRIHVKPTEWAPQKESSNSWHSEATSQEIGVL